MEARSGIAPVANALLYYEMAGSGEPIVLIHGYSLDTRMWNDQFEPFTRHYRVIRYDLRGFGQSSLPTREPYDHADDLAALLNYLGIARASVVGLSMGGWIATHFALNHPQLIQKLILVDSVLIGHDWSHEWNDLWQAIEEAAKTVGLQAAKQRWLAHPLFAPALEQATVASRLRQMVAAYSGWHWINDDTHRPVRPPDSRRLDQIQAPTLIVVGERDLPDFHTIANTLQQSIPNAQKVILPGVGHMANMEAPQRFKEVVLRFLQAE